MGQPHFPGIKQLIGWACVGLGVLLSGATAAETYAPDLGASPIPQGAELRFCYYAGLAYSAGAVITIEVPIRREVVSDRPFKAFRCVPGEGAENRHLWQAIDPDAGDPFRD